MNAAIGVAQQIKDKLVAATQPGVDRSKIQSEITQLQSQLQSVGDSTEFSGQNWLSVDSSATGYSATKAIVSSFSRSGAAVSISTINVDTSTTKLFDAADQSGILDKTDTTTNGGVSYSVSTLDISTLTDSANDQADLKQMVSYVDAAIAKMTTAASDLGAVKQRTSMQQDFVSKLMDAITTGVGTLVDADMNAESTKLQALQVQQQLGVQALSIANQNNQTILSLFR
jgi:flagellin